MRLLKNFFELIRWPNLLIIVLTQYMALLCLVEGMGLEQFGDISQFKITIVTVLVAAAGYIINDYFDIKIDLVNKPSEVYIGRTIKRRSAMLWHQVFNVTATVIAWTLGLKVFVVTVLAITLLWFYASIFKKRAFWGNFLVAGLTAASLVIMAVYYPKNDLLINIYAVFAFGISLIREIVKDCEDIRGDKEFGSTTIPIILGLKKTKWLIFVIMTSFAIIVGAMGLALKNPKLQVSFLVMGIPYFYLAYKLYWADRKSHFNQLSQICKYIMILGTLSMLTLL